jgi:signal transduction histidine kinase
MSRRAMFETLAVLCVLAATLGLLAADGFGTPDADARSLDGPGVLLAALTSVPLALAARFPLAAAVAVVGATIALIALAYPLDVSVGALVLAYRLAAQDPPPLGPVRRRAAQAAIVLLVPCSAVALSARGEDVVALLPELGGWALLVAGAWVAGDRSRLRRVVLADVRDRLARTKEALERERRLAVAEERARIARELHDSAGHAVNVVLVQAGAARLLHDRDPERSLQAIATIERVSRDTLGEIDQLVRALRADDDAELPLSADAAALEDLLRRHCEAGLRVTATVDGSDRAVPRNVAWGGYRILQEALTNAARHGTGTADITLRFQRPDLSLSVVNPVAGDSEEGRRGHGLIGMSERAALLGGTLDAVRENGHFRLEARLPYAEGRR